MQISQVTVEFRRTVSDGNYGNETAAMQFTIDIDRESGEDPQFVGKIALSAARAHVLAELKESGSLNIRRALIPQIRKCNRCGEVLPDDFMGYLHPACSELERAERDERRQAEARDLEEMPF